MHGGLKHSNESVRGIYIRYGVENMHRRGEKNLRMLCPAPSRSYHISRGATLCSSGFGQSIQSGRFDGEIWSFPLRGKFLDCSCFDGKKVAVIYVLYYFFTDVASRPSAYWANGVPPPISVSKRSERQQTSFWAWVWRFQAFMCKFFCYNGARFTHMVRRSIEWHAHCTRSYLYYYYYRYYYYYYLWIIVHAGIL